jgi:hypothetical protein
MLDKTMGNFYLISGDLYTTTWQTRSTHKRTPLYNKGGSKPQLFSCTQNYLFYIQENHGVDN